MVLCLRFCLHLEAAKSFLIPKLMNFKRSLMQ